MKTAMIGTIGLSLMGLLACGTGADGVDGEDGADGANGADGTDGMDGTDGADGADGMDGTDGADGQSCTLDEDADGNLTLQCGDETVTLDTLGMGGSAPVNGNDATSCTVTDNEDGSATISCPDGSEATVLDGADGMDGMDGLDGTVGASCSVVDNNDGSVTVSCPDGTTATVSDGVDGMDGANGMDGADGVDGVDGGGVLTASDTSSTGTALGDDPADTGISGCVGQGGLAVNLTVPTAGMVVFSGTVGVRINHTTGEPDAGYVGISESIDACAAAASMSFFTVRPEEPTQVTTLAIPVTNILTVSPGSHTFFLTGVMISGFTNSNPLDQFTRSNITAIFVPN